VGAIRAFANILKDQVEDKLRLTVEDIVELAEKILAEAGKLNVRLPERFQGADILKVLDEALLKVRFNSNIKVVKKLPEALPSVEGGEAQLKNIYVNLFQNAVDAMPNGGQLEIEAQVQERDGMQWIRFSVSDTGIGIPKKQLENVFDRYFTTKGAGHGFGLWWNKNYIERLGGWLGVESSVGEGTCFTMLLPASEKKMIVGEQ
jgi:signal transduction histidine kinase